MPIALKVAWAEGKSWLEQQGVVDAAFESELLLRTVLKISRESYLANEITQISLSAYKVFKDYVKRRSLGEPMQYIIGKQEFFGRSFVVNPTVLIPRPETELLIELIISKADDFRDINIADLGTGSGAIAITLALELSRAKIFAVDISSDALTTAKLNASRHDAYDRIHFMQGDYLEPLVGAKQRLDIVVSNPPYIESAALKTLQKEVRDFEPRLALDGGEDGIEPYRHILSQILRLAYKPTLLAFEIGYNQGNKLLSIFGEALPEYNIEIQKDFSGLDRVLIGEHRK